MDSADKRPTLRSLAAITGLGISTVSQALRNSPDIAEDTRRRVQLAAQQAGYRPNRAGVRLRTGKTNVITVILNAEQDVGSSGFFGDFVYGVTDGLKDTGYHLVITPYSLSDSMEPIRYVVETNSADGVIFSRTEPNDPRVRYLLESAMPFACHGRTDMGISHPYHDFDNETFAREAVRILVQRGRHRISLLGPPRELTYSIHTNKGFERGIAETGAQAVPYASHDIDTPIADLREAARALGSQGSRPTGFVCSSVAASYATVAGYRDAGLELGRDFDVVTKHTTEFVKLFSPGLISIPEDFRFAGRDLAQKLLAAIRGEPPETLQHIERPSLETLARLLSPGPPRS
jgi:LacI family transcriptional regulator